MPISLDEFVRSLTDTGILPQEELTSIVDSLPDARVGADVEKLARELVRQQKLTSFQASVIFKRQSRGLRIGDYVVLDKLGSGAMGQVFKSENRQTGEMVALKLLRASFSKSEKAVARFYRESTTASRLKHRNLVSVSDSGAWNGLHYLVMELVEGRDVRSVVKERGPLTVEFAIDLVLQAARGLEYAHQHGIVHRDIKPANLLLDHSGRVVILDLGLARLEDTENEGDGQDGGRLTMPGHFVGTLEYASPEQAKDAHEVDGRTDIYSLGCTLYYLLRGRPPYRHDNAALIMLAHCQDPIPSLGDLGAPPRLDALFQRMLAKKAAGRVGTMTEVIAELEACLQELKPVAKPRVASRSAQPAPTVPPMVRPKPRNSASVTLRVDQPVARKTSRAPESPPPKPVRTPKPAPELEFAMFVVDEDEAPPPADDAPRADETPLSEEAPAEPAPADDRSPLRFWLTIAGAGAAALALSAGAFLAAGWVASWLRGG